MKRLWNPALVLYLLSPMCGELLSGSQPPLEFFRPFNLLLITAFYGSGALLVREITRRWRRGWPTLLLLGAAYGIVEEGLAVKSFFDPTWMDLGALSVYGRWLGVNWIWAVHLTLFHAVFSIAIPVLLTEILFPDRSSQPWLTPRGCAAASIVFAGLVILMHVAITPYRVPWTHLAGSMAVVLALAALARRAPREAVPTRTVRPISRLRAALLGVLATLALFLLAWLIPTTEIPAWLTAIAMLSLAAWTARRVVELTHGAGWTERHLLALASGGLSFFFLLAPLLELDANAPEDRSGMTLAAVLFAAGLWLIDRRLRRTSFAPPIADASPRLRPAAGRDGSS